MVVDRSYKISAFGDYLDIVPDTDTMMFFLESFKEYGLVPSIFQEFRITPSSPQTIAIQRIALLSRDSRKQVTISSNRIDFEVKVQDDVKLSSDELVIINKEVEYCFQVVFEKFRKKVDKSGGNCKTLLVTSSRCKDSYGNSSDDLVENYNYDYTYRNDGTIADAESEFTELLGRMLGSVK